MDAASTYGLSAIVRIDMRAVVQRVSRAAVRVEERIVGEIGAGLLVLLGVAAGDTDAEADALPARSPGSGSSRTTEAGSTAP
jgi:hypothetical protein